MDKKIIEELADKLAAAVPGPTGQTAGDLGEELRNSMRTVLHSTLDKMDLVTREEFDVQRKVLERTRAKLERLQTELEEMQRETSGDNATGSD